MKPEEINKKKPLILHFMREVDVSQNWELNYEHAYYHSRKYNNRMYNVFKFHKKL